MHAAAAPAAAMPVIHAGHVPAAAAALAALAITAAVGGFLTRKRLAWETCFDMPVGLTAPHGADTGRPFELLLGEPGLRYPDPWADSTEQGWIVLLGITNPGCAPVRGRDFRIPLTFTFPGRRIHATRIVREPSGRAGRPAAGAPAIRLSARDSAEPSSGAIRPTRMHFTGDYVLCPNDSYTVMLLLSGTPAAPADIHQEGTLARGKIISRAGKPATRRDHSNQGKNRMHLCFWDSCGDAG
jgi:hypothetical protein